MPNYFTIPEFAKLKNTTRQTIYTNIKNNNLDTAEMYGKLLIKNTKKNDMWKPVEYNQRFKKRGKK